MWSPGLSNSGVGGGGVTVDGVDVDDDFFMLVMVILVVLMLMMVFRITEEPAGCAGRQLVPTSLLC